MYQTYQLSDYGSLKGFAEKLSAKYEIQFDEEMSRPVLLDAIKSIVEPVASPESTEESELSVQPTLDLIADLKAHIDKRMVELSSSAPRTADNEKGTISYSVSIDIPGKKKLFVEVNDDTSVQDVLDNVYYMLDGIVDSYTYLQQWLLRESETGNALVVREVQSRIPARFIFSPSSNWQVVKLRRPYSAADSLASMASASTRKAR